MGRETRPLVPTSIFVDRRRCRHEPRVKKSPIQTAGLVKIVNDAQEPWAFHAIEAGLDIGQVSGLLFFISEFR